MLGSYATIPIPGKKKQIAFDFLTKRFKELGASVFMDSEEPDSFQIDYPWSVKTEFDEYDFAKKADKILNKYFKRYRKHL